MILKTIIFYFHLVCNAKRKRSQKTSDNKSIKIQKTDDNNNLSASLQATKETDNSLKSNKEKNPSDLVQKPNNESLTNKFPLIYCMLQVPVTNRASTSVSATNSESLMLSIADQKNQNSKKDSSEEIELSHYIPSGDEDTDEDVKEHFTLFLYDPNQKKYVTDYKDFTFPLSIKVNRSIKLDLSLFTEINFINIIDNLEKFFEIRFKNIYKHLTNDRFPVYLFEVQKEPNFDNLKEVIDFLNLYIFNQNLKTTFLNDKNNLKENIISELNFFIPVDDVLGEILTKFNSVLSDYFSDIGNLISALTKKYYLQKFIHLDESEKNDFNENFCKFCRNLFYNSYNLVIVTIFPEIKLFFNCNNPNIRLRKIQKKLQILFSILIFRFHLLKSNFKKIYEINNNNHNFVITNSDYINFFIFETRCLLCLYGFNILQSENDIKFLIYKTFISFIRLINVDYLQKAKFNDFLEFKTFLEKKYFDGTILRKKLIKTKLNKYIKIYRLVSVENKEIKDYFNLYKSNRNDQFDNQDQRIHRFYTKNNNDFLDFKNEINAISSKLRNYLFFVFQQ